MQRAGWIQRAGRKLSALLLPMARRPRALAQSPAHHAAAGFPPCDDDLSADLAIDLLEEVQLYGSGYRLCPVARLLCFADAAVVRAHLAALVREGLLATSEKGLDHGEARVTLTARGRAMMAEQHTVVTPCDRQPHLAPC